MPRLRPFRGLRYVPDAGPPSELLAPPYDVIGSDEAAELHSRSPYNAVRLVLPEGEGPERHGLAARRLADWRKRNVLARDEELSVYLYRQRFTDEDGGTTTRSALFAELELVPLDGGQVLPHEETHRGPKEDRLALMEATGTQLSPVFLVARDEDRRLRDGMAKAAAGAETVITARTPDGIGHELRRMPEGRRSAALLEAAGAGRLLIADGHHRYETALELRRRHPDWPGAGGILTCVVSGRDPGLRILPTHRTLRRPPDGSDWQTTVEPSFHAEVVPPREPEHDAADAATLGDGRLVLRGGGSGADGWRLRPRREAVESAGLTAAEARLGPVIFDRLLLRAAYELKPDAAAAGLLSYHRDPGEALAAAGEDGAAVYLPPLSLDAVWEVCSSRGRLPPKSTYFWPKVPSGLLFRPVAG